MKIFIPILVLFANFALGGSIENNIKLSNEICFKRDYALQDTCHHIERPSDLTDLYLAQDSETKRDRLFQALADFAQQLSDKGEANIVVRIFVESIIQGLPLSQLETAFLAFQEVEFAHRLPLSQIVARDPSILMNPSVGAVLDEAREVDQSNIRDYLYQLYFLRNVDSAEKAKTWMRSALSQGAEQGASYFLRDWISDQFENLDFDSEIRPFIEALSLEATEGEDHYASEEIFKILNAYAEFLGGSHVTDLDAVFSPERALELSSLFPNKYRAGFFLRLYLNQIVLGKGYARDFENTHGPMTPELLDRFLTEISADQRGDHYAWEVQLAYYSYAVDRVKVSTALEWANIIHSSTFKNGALARYVQRREDSDNPLSRDELRAIQAVMENPGYREQKLLKELLDKRA